jgi:hypothetical protein
MEYSKTPEINAAVNWWVETISIKDKPKYDNGNQADKDFFDIYVSNPEPATPDELERFGKSLATVIEREYAKEQYLYIGTDYRPDGLLEEAFDCALLPAKRNKLFPVKTRTWLENGTFRIKAGYSAGLEQVYP